jgi:hypothetical protein
MESWEGFREGLGEMESPGVLGEGKYMFFWQKYTAQSILLVHIFAMYTPIVFLWDVRAVSNGYARNRQRHIGDAVKNAVNFICFLYFL